MQNLTVSPPIDSHTPSPTRLHYLDWLRVIATLAVFIFHALNPFNVFDFHIKNAEQSIAISVFQAFFFSWGMPFFFLIAGAGSWFSLRRRTTEQYTRERVSRLLIPFLVGSIVLTPLQLYFEWSHKTQTGVVQGSFWEFLNSLWVGVNPRLFGLVGYHLWFVGFLFVFSLLTIPLFRWLNAPSGKRLVSHLADLCEHRGAILLFILPLALIRLSLHPFFPHEHHWADFFFLMAFFVLGYIVFADGRFAQVIRRDWKLLLTIGVASTVVSTAMGLSAESFDIEAAPRTLWDFALWSLIVINSWCWALFVLYIGMRYLDYTNRWLQYGQEAILPFYMFHQPVIIVIAFFVVQWTAGIPLKLLVTIVGSFAISIGLYELVIRRTNLLRSMFGMKTVPRQAAQPAFSSHDPARHTL